ncbi:uncharacterized protein N7511_006448 [Penicillium nucicola]|uniref:uncharacterized protein n=1 Tax=Penicillium nucicola TaxID=1850975 RepID=UPI002545B4FB|nr:uncharacterized protein N7511_006448 [Penicillium nucicola]KAJ5757754.1 hypothetical protein N7511_006448 [Penicillium nucicola]
MQSMPTLLKHSLRSSIQLHFKGSSPVRAHFRPATPTFSITRPTPRSFSACVPCQFRRQPETYAAFDDKDKFPSEAEKVIREREQELGSRDPVPIPGVEVGSSHAAPPHTEPELSAEQINPKETEVEQEKVTQQEQDATEAEAKSGGLPSYLESRRSQMSKQFSTMMDNLQSNVFVAGQRLNDLTGYSSIEALKNDIQFQESRLRAARSHVKQAKEDYASAINRRSTSQREVNELLQRKHAWSPTDLERFTLLYRNDHTNEVAETETSHALSAAEREAEEAAAQLSKSILSRYHEEQVWSDKIRRMSTWGTWGLMGVNVLLFLVFQILVEPWRRKRLVKGFEDKVVEALEKEKELNRAFLAETAGALSAIPSAFSSEIVDATSDTEPSIPIEDAPVAVKESLPVAVEAANATAAPSTDEAVSDAGADAALSLQSRLLGISHPPTSVEYWKTAFHEFFSERSVAVSQRDVTTVALQSAAAGAAVMGFLFAIFRSG